MPREDQSAYTDKQKRQDSLQSAIDPGVRIGHAHLKVSDLKRSLAFYCGVLGFEIMQLWGDQAAFISAGGYHLPEKCGRRAYYLPLARGYPLYIR